ncbi:hypothetical protein MCUN1_001174 [Malassezia cuniculi]|uniref:Shugoshin C-terminal domain-containing protein n=1 Tax=Malassezia cuniculi TaxID=948313 RepID=A0AAF0J5R5_9BASI|nr:hypothetical protein MCUN1_001174 [Malassezia cuniculi]
MAPTTRRESRTSGAAPADAPWSALNLEQILDNFEQFRRKHMAQNRDIIRANTLAQLRIRELEARVQALEQERADQALEAARQSAHARRVEYALECVRVGWETIARGLDEAGVQARDTPVAAVEFAPPPAFQPSTHIELESAPTSRQFLARDCPTAPPIAEEDAAPASVTVRRHRRAATPEDEGGYEDISGHATIDMDTTEAPGALQVPQVPTAPEMAETGDAPDIGGDMESGDAEVAAAAAAAAAAASSSFAPLDAAAAEICTATLPSGAQDAREAPNEALLEPAPHAAARDDSSVDSGLESDVHESSADTHSNRRQSRTSRASRVPADLGIDEPLGTRRARKSINYALPKLNTKMRKPDSEPQTQPQPKRRRSTMKGPRSSKASSEERDDGAEDQENNSRDEEDKNGSSHHENNNNNSVEAESAQTESATSATAVVEVEPAASESTAFSPASRLASMYADSTAPLAPGTPALPKGTRRVPRRPLSENSPFVPMRKSSKPSVDVQALQENSAQHMPSWASSLMNLASPEPPRRKSRGMTR